VAAALRATAMPSPKRPHRPSGGRVPGGGMRKESGGWKKPVSPPKQQGRPAGLPPKKGK
jgi:hypothetical protein